MIRAWLLRRLVAVLVREGDWHDEVVRQLREANDALTATVAARDAEIASLKRDFRKLIIAAQSIQSRLKQIERALRELDLEG